MTALILILFAILVCFLLVLTLGMWAQHHTLETARKVLKINGIQPIDVKLGARHLHTRTMSAFHVSYYDDDGNVLSRNVHVEPTRKQLIWINESPTANISQRPAPFSKSSKEQLIDELSAENAELKRRLARFEAHQEDT